MKIGNYVAMTFVPIGARTSAAIKKNGKLISTDEEKGTARVAVVEKRSRGVILEIIEVALESITDIITEGSRFFSSLQEIFRRLPDVITMTDVEGTPEYKLTLLPYRGKDNKDMVAYVEGLNLDSLKVGKIEINVLLGASGDTLQDAKNDMKQVLIEAGYL